MPDDSQFCRKCGSSLGIDMGGGSGTAPAPANESRPSDLLKELRTTREHGFGNAVLRVFGLLFIVGLVIASLWWLSGSSKVSPNAPGPLQELTQREYTQTLPQSAFTVNVLSSQSYRFVIPDGAARIHIEGRFSATGGSGNDVEVALMDQDGYVNFQNRHAVQTYYNSGRQTQGVISADLPKPGTYFLVFSNRFSLLTPKAVTANATLTYLK